MIYSQYTEDEFEKIMLINQDSLRQKNYSRNYQLEQEILQKSKINVLAYIEHEVLYEYKEDEIKQILSFVLILKTKKDYDSFVSLAKTKGKMIEDDTCFELSDLMNNVVRIKNNYFFYATKVEPVKEVVPDTTIIQDVFKKINHLTHEEILPEEKTIQIVLNMNIRPSKTWEALMVGTYEKSI